MQDRPLEFRPLVPTARTDSPERNDEKFVVVNPFVYESPFSEVLGHYHKLFGVGDGGLLHDPGPRDVHPGVSSRVRNGRLEDPEVPSLVAVRLCSPAPRLPKKNLYSKSGAARAPASPGTSPLHALHNTTYDACLLANSTSTLLFHHCRYQQLIALANTRSSCSPSRQWE
jgi:hypothetical protein